MTEFKARPTVYKGTQMRSRLEAGYAAWLDKNGFRWEYEPCAFATEDGQYLPDFRLHEVRLLSPPVGTRTVYVEVKHESYDWGTADADRLLRSMCVILHSEPDAILITVQPVAPYASLGVVATDPSTGEPRTGAGMWVLADRDGPPGLAWPLWGESAPWYGEYWKVP